MKKQLLHKTDAKPLKMSRTKIELFIDCPRCFYLDQKLGVKRPSGPPFTLNAAVDHLLKQEFDVYRAKGTKHPLQKEYKIDAVPAKHEQLGKWMHNFTGIQYHHKKTNFLVYGAIDDLWIDSKNNYIVVDYKATAKANIVRELGEEKWYQAYRRQMEIYQWLLRKNKLKVSDTGYFVYCTGLKDKKAFDKRLEFEVVVIPYKGSDKWVEKAIISAHDCLSSRKIPKASNDCQFCNYRQDAKEVEK
jgi:hypothetical protein